MLRLLSRLRTNISGNAAVVVALSLPVVMAGVGGAVDFSRSVQLRMELQDAADVASLGAVAINSPGYKAGLAMNGDGQVPAGVASALSVFYSDYQNHDDLVGVTPGATVMKTGSTLVAKVDVAATYKPYLLGLAGVSKVNVSVTSTASATVPPYIDFYLLLDNSPSMGVGATTKDINVMVSNTSDQCAFACHEDDKPGADYYAKAKTLGVTTRIDVVRQATQNLMATAASTQSINNQYRMATYDFGKSANTIDSMAPTAYQVGALTGDLTSAASNAAGIDLMTIPYQGYNSDRITSFNSVLTSMNNIIPAAGSGMAASTPQKVLFFVSDGANDSYDCNYSNGNSCRRITPLDTTMCKALKDRGVRIAVLYTTYLPLPTNSFYNQYMAKYITPVSQLAAQMQTCASPGLYFEVSPSQGISDAMTALFKRVITVVRINA